MSKFLKTISKSALIIGLSMISSTAFADGNGVVNPGFETGDSTGWTLSGGYWSSGWPIPPDQYSGSPSLAYIVNAGNNDGITGTPVVFAGNYALQLNDANGGNHLTAASQTVTDYNSNKLYFAWNAVLQPSHGETDSPSFLINVTDLTSGNSILNISYSAYSAQNSTIFRSVNGYVTTDWKVEEVDMIAGHDYKLTFLGADCIHGGHGGYVYLDGFGNVIPLHNGDVDFDPLNDVTHGNQIVIPIGGSNIDTSQPFYTTAQLTGGQIQPNFLGGILQFTGDGSFGQNFSVGSQGGTFDTNGFNGDINGNISGTGGLTKTGAGNLFLTGTTSLGSTFYLIGGRLYIVGSVDAPSMVVSGGHLGGNGLLNGNLLIGAGGHLAPGSSPGTLNVAGSVVMDTGSFFDLEIDGKTYNAAGGAGTYDRLVVSGEGNSFTAGGVLVPITRGITGAANNNFTPALGDSFTFVTADSILGGFASVTQPTSGMLANTRFDVLYGAKDVKAVVTPANYGTWGISNSWKQNAVNAAKGLDAVRPSAGTRNGNLQSLFNNLYGMTNGPLSTAFQEISGEIHADALQSVHTNANLGQDILQSEAQGKFDSANTHRGVVWGQVYGAVAQARADDVAQGYDDNNYGVYLGVNFVDTANTRLGVAAGYSENSIKSDVSSSADLKSVSYYLYGRQNLGQSWSINGVIGGARQDIDTERNVTLLNGTSLSTSSSHASMINGSLLAKYKVPTNKGFEFYLVGGAQAARISAAAVTEANNTPNIALNLHKTTWSTAQSKLGGEVVFNKGNYSGTVYANWLHEFSDEPTAVRDVHLGNASWQVSSVVMPRDSFNLGARLEGKLTDNVSLSGGINGISDGSHYQVGVASLGLRVKF